MEGELDSWTSEIYCLSVLHFALISFSRRAHHPLPSPFEENSVFVFHLPVSSLVELRDQAETGRGRKKREVAGRVLAEKLQH
jgi:hypothetical protein